MHSLMSISCPSRSLPLYPDSKNSGHQSIEPPAFSPSLKTLMSSRAILSGLDSMVYHVIAPLQLTATLPLSPQIIPANKIPNLGLIQFSISPQLTKELSKHTTTNSQILPSQKLTSSWSLVLLSFSSTSP